MEVDADWDLRQPLRPADPVRDHRWTELCGERVAGGGFTGVVADAEPVLALRG